MKTYLVFKLKYLHDMSEVFMLSIRINKEINQRTINKQRKMIRGTVLDLPLKGKTTETCFAKGMMSIVQPVPRTS